MERTKLKPRRAWIFVSWIILGLCVLGTVVVAGINLWVTGSVRERILTWEQATALKNVDCIIVLGCGVHSDGTPSHMLEDRLKQGIALYQQGAAPKLLMSGDHGTKDYDEVNVMKGYAVKAGVPSEDVFMDHAGFSTYDTMSRAKHIFGAEKVIVVTQQYHLYRAVYLARAMGMEAYGVPSDYRQYSGQFARDVREVLARVKDFGMAILKPDPTYLGEPIPVDGNGALTHDENSNFE